MIWWKEGEGNHLEGRVGDELGRPVGHVGDDVGCREGCLEGCLEGWPVGLVGFELGCVDGFDGRALGCLWWMMGRVKDIGNVNQRMC